MEGGDLGNLLISAVALLVGIVAIGVSIVQNNLAVRQRREEHWRNIHLAASELGEKLEDLGRAKVELRSRGGIVGAGSLEKKLLILQPLREAEGKYSRALGRLFLEVNSVETPPSVKRLIFDLRTSYEGDWMGADEGKFVYVNRKRLENIIRILGYLTRSSISSADRKRLWQEGELCPKDPLRQRVSRCISTFRYDQGRRLSIIKEKLGTLMRSR